MSTQTFLGSAALNASYLLGKFNGIATSSVLSRLADVSYVAPLLVFASLVVLGTHILWTGLPRTAFLAKHTTGAESSASIPTSLKDRIELQAHSLGGATAYSYAAVRVIASFVLFVISLVIATNDYRHRDGLLSDHQFKILLRFGESIAYFYTFVIATVSICATPKWNRIVTRHLNLIYLLVFILFAYRDLVPFGLVNNRPAQDAEEGNLLWVRVSLLALVAVVIPLLSPRPYIPLEKKNPSRTPNPEQAASILSLALYSYMDSFIWRGYNASKESADELPQLSDYDFASHLKNRGFKFLDTFSGASPRHLIFGITSIFRKDIASIIFLVILSVLASFISPIGIYQLLKHIESPSTDAILRPWVYIALLFIGPVTYSVSMQRYMFLTTRILVRLESMFTQLIFEHSLRTRINAEERGQDSATQSESSVQTDSNSMLPPAEPASENESSVEKDNMVGKIMNLVTTDLQNVGDGRDVMLVLIALPLQVVLCAAFLYRLLGWSAFVGQAVMVALLPVPAAIAKLMNKASEEKMARTDVRVQEVTETMNVVRMVKLFGWEGKMAKRIGEQREKELHWVKRTQWLTLLNFHVNYTIPLIVMITTFGTYTWVLGKPLSSALLFSSASVFAMLQQQLGRSVRFFDASIRAKVSLQRITDFLRTTNLLDRYEDTSSSVNTILTDNDIVGIRHATFSWSPNVYSDIRGSSPQFGLKIEGSLEFAKGEINLIMGPTGGGKTSLLMALLGEMRCVPLSSEARVDLPRAGGISYAAQEAWVLNDTIKNNILFGSKFEESRYQKVLYQCALEHDISLFDAGDETEVGEKGITLSGGQKARLTLARAVYHRSSVLLLDDVFAALDVHTAQWIVDKCFKGDLIEGRSVLLVSHNVALVRPIANRIFAVKEGRVTQVDHERYALEITASELASENGVQPSNGNADKAKNDAAIALDGKLILEEDIEEGHMSWNAFRFFIEAMGGKHPILFVIACVGSFFLTEGFEVFQYWFLGLWASEYERKIPADVQAGWYISMYMGIVVLIAIFFTMAFVSHLYGGVRASRVLHQNLIGSVLRTTMRWHDVTPVSRIITRCTQDIQRIDTKVSAFIADLNNLTVSMITRLISVVLVIPFAMVGGLVVALVGGICGQFYIHSQLRVKRLMSNAKAPLLAHLHASVAGLVSIRAYGVEEDFKDKSLRLIDSYSRTARTLYSLSCWMSIRIDTLGGIFAAGLAAYIVYGHGIAANAAGFCIDQAVIFSSMILWWVSRANELEVEANSVERIYAYSHIEQEQGDTEAGQPPAYWPASGDLQVHNLSARYSPNGSEVLHNLSFHLKSGERIGIVGRTGSGKSSLTLSLLRCILTEGHVSFDGLDTSNVNLDALRSSITIIPQMPELLRGTMRQNLDPFDQYDDATLNSALQAAGFTELQKDIVEGKFTLDSTISGGGQNLSVGQRQILALARAIVRRSKLLILDEATSAIDYKTDAIIQESLRTHLDKDTTLITVAHRLQTIMDADRIMVLDSGNMAEFDSPKALLKDPDSKFRALVDQSGDKADLYSMAGM